MHSVARTLTTAAALLAAWALLDAPSNGRAASTPAAKCAVAKIRAAFKKVSAKGACYEKAIANNAPVDPACLMKAEAAFSLAFQRAEAKGGCITSGDATAVEGDVDGCVGGLVGAEPSIPCHGPDGAGECSGACSTGMVCAATSQTSCTCVPGDQLCAFSFTGTCGGLCTNARATCFGHSTPPVSCGCVTFCSNSAAPQCGGACFLGGTCQANASGGCSCPNGG